MKPRVTFLKEYIKNPKQIGSITPSSKKLRDSMLNHINFNKDNIIIEYGPGNGIFSEKIFSKMTPNSTLVLVEFNKTFVRILKEKFQNSDNVIVIQGSVENIDVFLKELNLIDKVDYIVSGIPFLSLGKKFTNKVFYKTSKILNNSNGSFLYFQYSFLLEKYLKRHFHSYKKKFIMKNFPPAIVYKTNEKIV